MDFVQDPDVLDTWFSSALWPHSTLGWPADGRPAKWYPTAVLMTGRDIITLWVARMVMMGMYNMGEKASAEGRVQSAERKTGGEVFLLPLPFCTRNSATLQSRNSLGIPFTHVVINPTILDGKGERMSKSKGNGVDPVDIIDTHGADALRFTLDQHGDRNAGRAAAGEEAGGRAEYQRPVRPGPKLLHEAVECVAVRAGESDPLARYPGRGWG